MQSFHEAFSASAHELLDLEVSLESRSLAGGTSKDRVLAALTEVEAEIAAEREKLDALEAADREEGS
jgi:argininosuccinate lyase